VDPSLPSRAAEIVIDLPESRSVAVAGVVTWSRGGTPYAVLGPTAIEIRLDRAVAGAAARTPDAAPSPRGPEWVRFEPAELDAHAVNRLRAWLEAAYRRAGDGGA
jgi:hypothetical protein